MMLSDKVRKLDQLWREVDLLHHRYFPNHQLKPIPGGGASRRPQVMFVFINPTARNISTDPSWTGPRYPFIGTKQIWRVLSKAGLFDPALLTRIESSSRWSVQFTRRVEGFLRTREIYVTNLVKWTGYDSALPSARMVRLFLPVLEKEIDIVRPRFILAFGQMPFTALTGLKLSLSEYYSVVEAERSLRTFPLRANPSVQVVPCYFPIGRGKPQRAIEILRLLPTIGVHVSHLR